MTAYQVFGKAKVYANHSCDCEYCHRSEEIEEFPDTVEIDARVEADNEVDAKTQAEADYIKIEWDYVTVVDLSKSVPIRSQETELELLKRWNEGRGLPARINERTRK